MDFEWCRRFSLSSCEVYRVQFSPIQRQQKPVKMKSRFSNKILPIIFELEIFKNWHNLESIQRLQVDSHLFGSAQFLKVFLLLRLKGERRQSIDRVYVAISPWFILVQFKTLANLSRSIWIDFWRDYRRKWIDIEPRLRSLILLRRRFDSQPRFLRKSGWMVSVGAICKVSGGPAGCNEFNHAFTLDWHGWRR